MHHLLHCSNLLNASKNIALRCFSTVNIYHALLQAILDKLARLTVIWIFENRETAMLSKLSQVALILFGGIPLFFGAVSILSAVFNQHDTYFLATPVPNILLVHTMF